MPPLRYDLSVAKYPDKPRASSDAELELAIVGEGVAPRDVPLREVIALLEAMAGLLEEAAKEMDLPPPACTLTAVRKGSAEYALPIDEVTSDDAVARYALNAARTRGVDAPPSVRRQIARLHKASGVGPVRLALRGPNPIAPFLLAAPKDDADPELEEVEDLHATIVGVTVGRQTEFKVRLRLEGARTEEFTADDEVAEQAASFFNRSVRARVTFYRTKHDERPGAIERVDADEAVDLMRALTELRDDVRAAGVEIDASAYLEDNDESTDRHR